MSDSCWRQERQAENELADLRFERERAMQIAQSLLELESENADLRDERDKAIASRKHTWDYITLHYGKLNDWARTILPEPYRNQFFNCVANGLWDPCKDVGKEPNNYFCMGAQEAMLFEQFKRAEDAESENIALRAKLKQAKDELDDERQAHSEIADICLQAGAELDDGTSVSAVRNLRAKLEQAYQSLHWLLCTTTRYPQWDGVEWSCVECHDRGVGPVIPHKEGCRYKKATDLDEELGTLAAAQREAEKGPQP